MRWIRPQLFAPDDGNGTNGGGGGTPAPAPKPADPAAGGGSELAKLQAERDEARSKLATFEKQQADAAKAAEAEKRKQLEEQGQHKTLAEQLKAEKAELEKKLADLDDDVKLGKAFREAEQKKLDETLKSLSAEDRALVEAQGSFAARVSLAARLAKTEPAKPQHTPTGTGTPPAPSSVVDIDLVIKERGADFAKANHPKEWAAFIDRRSKATGKSTGGLFGGLFSRA